MCLNFEEGVKYAKRKEDDVLKRSKTRDIQTEVKRKTSFTHFSISPKFNYFIVIFIYSFFFWCKC